MKRGIWLRFLAISAFFAVLLSVLYFILMREVAGDASDEVQRSIYLFIAHIVEEQPYAESIKRVERLRTDSPAMPMELWVLSESGQVLAGSSDTMPPRLLQRMEKPRHVHEVVSRGRFFSGAQGLALVRLDAAEPTYLAVHKLGTPGRHTFLILGALFVATMLAAILLGLLLVTLYLRMRSREVKLLIGQLESGDLAARFRPDRLDAIGRLMLDFNRMADEIERLVTRLQTSERARRELLQELGHDLRTPLTSLRTAIETLEAHGEVMSAPERLEFFRVVTSEFAYFRKLIDDLFFIAEIDEPHYRRTAERIDLGALITAEIALMESSHRAAREIHFECAAHTTGRLDIVGDPYLVARLFRNVFDNAAKFAHSSVRIQLSADSAAIKVRIDDDGPGMSAEKIAAFGKRRSQRLAANSGDCSVSLGLGSVIIKTIVELHGGCLHLESDDAGSGLRGTRLTISLPRADSPS